VRPTADIALPVLIASHRNHGAVGLEPHRAKRACGDHGRYVSLMCIQWYCRKSTEPSATESVIESLSGAQAREIKLKIRTTESTDNKSIFLFFIAVPPLYTLDGR